MYDWHPPRTLSAASSLAIVGLMFAALVLGLNVRRTAQSALRLVSIDLTQPPPQSTERPKAPRPHVRKPAPKHSASPRNVRNKATAIVAPPIKPLIQPPPVVTAPKAGPGAAANNGASNRPGPGQGAGGVGNGLGGGGLGGNGSGDGAGEAVVGPRQTGGRMSYRDLPDDVLAPGEEGAVDVLFAVNPDGHASDCRVERSSGHAVLDSLACRLIEQRFRFNPARDRFGRPVRAWMEETHTWYARER